MKLILSVLTLLTCTFARAEISKSYEVTLSGNIDLNAPYSAPQPTALTHDQILNAIRPKLMNRARQMCVKKFRSIDNCTIHEESIYLENSKPMVHYEMLRWVQYYKSSVFISFKL